ncbi:MAG: glucose-6-phosphate dehydrogenase [Actinobacteria bacterium]|nr:glucose-6-phosphate dehydrogenase [Actinomycetota bacterium]
MSDATTLVVLGVSGDMASRLLLPALGQLLHREPRRRFTLIGSDFKDWDDAKFRDVVRAAFEKAGATGAAVKHVAETATYRKADATSADDLTALLSGIKGRLALYLALPPAIAATTAGVLENVTLPADTVLALEKPFGTDAASAITLNKVLAALLPEDRVFRVDHFLGRSTVLNLLGVRFANRVFEPVWSAEDIESVVIRYDEKLGLENRAGYYDKAGALVDMIQSHLLQVLAFVAMEPPAALNALDVRDATAAVLRATHVWGNDPVQSSRRARYTAGSIGRRKLPSYVDEGGVDPSRETETLAEATFEVATERWAGVPFTLRSGKALGAACAEIVLRFREVRHLPAGFTGGAPGAVLRFSLGPDRMSLEMNVNGGADPFELDRSTLQTDLGAGTLLAYSEVLDGILSGDAALSVRGDAAVQCWRILEPILDAWKAGDVPLDEYPAGTEGPASWPALGDGRRSK